MYSYTADAEDAFLRRIVGTATEYEHYFVKGDMPNADIALARLRDLVKRSRGFMKEFDKLKQNYLDAAPNYYDN